MEDKLRNNKKKGIFRWITKKLIKRLFILMILIFLSFTGLVYYLPSTQFFKEFAGNKISEILKNELNAKINIKDIYFGRLGYIELDQVDLTLDGDTIAYIPNLQVDVDLLRLLDNKVKVRSLKIQSPYIKVWRGLDSVWNVTKIAKVSEDTSSGGKIPIIDIGKFEIINGNFHYIDSLSDISIQEKLFNYSNFYLQRFNLNLDAELDLDKEFLELENINTSFSEQHSGIEISNLNFEELQCSNNRTSINNIALGIDQSNIILEDFELLDFNPVSENYIDIEVVKLASKINSDNFNLNIVNYFSEEILFDSTYLKINAKIEANDESHLISDAKILYGSSSINFDSEIVGLFNDKLKFESEIINSHIYNSDVNILLKYFTDFKTKFKHYKLNNVSIKSDLTEYSIVLDSKLENSSIKGSVFVDIDKESYDAELSFKSINTDKILDDGFTSNLNGKLISNGSSFDPDSIKNTLYLELNNSSYDIITIDQLKTNISLNNNFVKIDSLSLGNNSNLYLTGEIDLKNINDMAYNLNMELKDFDLSKYLDSLYYTFSTQLVIKGNSIDPNNASVNITSLKPLKVSSKDYNFDNIDFVINSNNDLNKEFNIKSNFFNAGYYGQFNYDSLSYLFENIYKQLNNETNYLTRSILDSSIALDSNSFVTNPKANINFYFELINEELIKEFSDIIIKDTLDFNFELASDSNSISFNTEFNKPSFIIQESFDKYIIDGFKYDLNYSFKTKDYFDDNSKLYFNLSTKRISKAYDDLNDLNLDINKRENLLSLVFNADLNKIIDLQLDQDINFNDTQASLSINNFSFNFKDLFTLNHNNNLTLLIDNSQVDFQDFELLGNQSQTLVLNGAINFIELTFSDFTTNINNFDLREIYKIHPDEILTTLEGQIKTSELVLNGSLEDLFANLSIDAYNIKYNDVLLGHLNTEFNYMNSLLYGDLHLFNYELGTNLSLQVPEFPIDLSFTDKKTKMVNNETEMFIDITNFPLKAAEPFAVGVKNINGKLNSDIKIVGNIDDGLKFSGNLKIPNSSFVVEQSNIEYLADADIFISNDKLDFKSINIFNREKDLKNGSAVLKGFLTLDNFEPDEFSFKISSKKIKVLSEKTKYAMPNLFGDLIIATGKRSLFLEGNFDEKIIGGDLIIRKANLNMLDNREAVLIEKKINYVFKHELDDSSKVQESYENKLGPKKQSSFEQNLAYDLNLKFDNSININADISDIRLNIDLNTDGLTYVADYGEEPQLIGDVIILGEDQLGQSRLTFWGKTLTASGKVSFPTGNITNPTLDIVSQYEGITKNEIPFIVKILVAGTAEQPIIEFGYIYDNQEFLDQTDDNKRDAMALLIFNSRLTDLASGADNFDFGKESSDLANALLSNLLSRNLSESLGLEASVNLDLNNFTESNIVIGDDLFDGRLKWQVGGTPANPQNNEISIILPLSILNESKNLKNLNFEISKPNNPLATRENQKQWEVSLSFKKNW